ncbi:MAG TPA: serine/threonine-protein kinase, partial [Kofleriaceae bacterium]
YTCVECGRSAPVSLALSAKPRDRTCSTCGGTTRASLSGDRLEPIRATSAKIARESATLIERRDELLSRALTDANVAHAGDNATVEISTDDTILGKYKIVRRLSAGGMAEVYLANQIGIGGFEKPVALKRIQRKQLESRHQAIELFLNEAKIAGRLTHPNIAQVLDVGEAAGALYIAMDYVHGRDLRKIIRRLSRTGSTLPIGTTCYVVQEVAKALDYAYMSKDMAGKRLHVVHRDVTPHNIVLGYDGTVKLVDFGVAMSAVTEHAEPMIVGKWSYMSPETTLNEAIDHRSDLFSLGVILYLLLAGDMPFSGTEPREIVKNIRAGTYARLPAFVPDRLAALVDRMLAPLPEQRPQRGRIVVDELAAMLQLFGNEASPTVVASLLAELLPDDEAGRTTSGPHELVRALSGRSMTTIDQPPEYEVLGPAHGDGETSSRTVPADISETLKPARVPEASSLGLASTVAAERASTEPERAMSVVSLAGAPVVAASFPRRHAAQYQAYEPPRRRLAIWIAVAVI